MVTLINYFKVKCHEKKCTSVNYNDIKCDKVKSYR